MDLNFNEQIMQSKLFEGLHPKNTVNASDLHSDYPHLTFSIKSIEEFMQLVKLMNAAHYEDETIVFRGMSSQDWSAIPGLGRYIGDDETIEYKMVNEFMTLRPESFQGLSSNFEILSKMQHYGLPTRLLDFTVNPLVSLYFACADHPECDARILCSKTSLASTQIDIIDAICGAYKNYGFINLRIEDLVAETQVTPYRYIARLYLQKTSRPLFVKPKYWNQRIINQSAVFLVFPDSLSDHLGKLAYYNETPDNQSEILRIKAIIEHEKLDQVYPIWYPKDSFGHKLQRFIDQQKDENSLIRRDFSVNYKTMQKLFSFYPYEDVVIPRTYDYTLLGEHTLDRRFYFNGGIEPIDDESMQNDFCSIIVDRNAKREILQDLESIRIDRAFIYPELEYTAEKIKKKYF